jgi:signal transduction histidine kinase/CheY-like chemotaxis protein
MMRRTTLAGRLFVAVLGWYLLLAVSVTAIQLLIEFFTVSHAIDTDLDSLGRSFEPGVTEALWAVDRPLLASLAKGIKQASVVTGVQIMTNKGVQIAAEGDLPTLSNAARAGRLFARYRQYDIPLQVKLADGHSILAGYLIIYSGLSVVIDKITHSILIVLINSIIVTAGLWLIFFIIVKSTLSDNLGRIAAAVETWHLQLEKGEPEAIDYPYADELGTLVDALNFSHQRLEFLVATRTTELREAKQRADAASATKSEFLANMSHEIRTPITGVLGMADLLRLTPLNKEQLGYLDTLANSTRTLLTILNDILDISKIEAGKIVLEDVEFPLHEAVYDTISMFKANAAAKGLVVAPDFAGDLPRWVIGDPSRLKQLLFNLMSNAIKFTEHGSVTLRLAVKSVDGDRVILSVEVEDTGMGISPDQLPLLFQPFSQLGASTSRRFGGTGLGLAITRRLVEMMGGTIGVDSQLGQGTRFWFTLPVRRAPNRVAPSPEKASPATWRRLRTLRILVAEDNRINQMLVRTMLQKMGHTVQIAENGRLAVEAVAAGDFDVVLMDMQMPEMNGEDATRVIRAMPPPKNRLPILALTADAMVEQRDRYLAAGVNDLVPKPIDWDTLLAALETQTAEKPGERGPPGPA